MNTGERLKYLRKELLHMTGEQFSDALGVGRSSISNIESGTRPLTDQMIKSICMAYNVDESWLRTGEGEPFAPQTMNQYIADWVNRVMADRDESFRKRFIFALCNMDDRGWEILEKFISDLNKE